MSTFRGPAAGPRNGTGLPQAPTELVATPHGVRLERLVTGSGAPVTVFAHGLAGGIAMTRPLGSGVRGTRVFFQFRGHGRSDRPPGPWSYADLARDLRAVADLTAADRALGVSLGAGALARLLSGQPDRFDRVVFFLPAMFDQPRPPAAAQQFDRLFAAVAAGDAAAVTAVLADELPVEVRHTPAARAHLADRTRQLLADGLAPALAGLPRQTAVPDPAPLGTVSARALVVAAAGDELHPVPVAERLAAALPAAELHVYDRPGVLWNRRADLRDRIAGFLND